MVANDTKRTLLVTRKTTHSFLRIISGNFLDWELLELIGELKKEEIKSLEETIRELEEHKEDKILSLLSINQLNTEEINRIKKKLLANKLIIKNLLETNKFSRSENWFWPKGHKDLQDKNCFETALREFKEETNIDLKEQRITFISRKPLVYLNSKNEFFNDQIYLWIMVVEKELEVQETPEFEVKWFTFQDLLSLKENKKIAMLAYNEILKIY